jgi:bifunctional DNA-binding transcriptional regulator/antitoxin component of YhaV-PrlF toxin-antitoxin module
MRKIEEQNVRKIFKINQSYTVTLPISLIRALSWQEKQKVVIKRRGKELIISDWK